MAIHQGHAFFQEYDLYTTEDTKPNRLVHLYYLLLGQIGKYTGISDVSMYWLGLYFGFLIMYTYTYLLVTDIFSGKFRWIALYLIYFASPFPPLTINILSRNISIGTSWWTFMDIFSRVTYIPHHHIGQAMMVASVYYLIRYYRQKVLLYACLCSLCAVLGAFLYPLPIIYFLTGTAVVLFIKVVTNLIKNEAPRVYTRGIFKCFERNPPKHYPIPIKSGSSAKVDKIKSIERLTQYISSNKNYLLGYLCIFTFPFIPLILLKLDITRAGIPWNTFLTSEKGWNTSGEIYPYTLSVFLLSYGILPLFIALGMLKWWKKIRFENLLFLVLLVIPVICYYLTSLNLIAAMKIRCAHGAPYVFAGILAVYGIERLIGWGKTKVIKMIIGAILVFLIGANTISGLMSYWIPEVYKNDLSRNLYIPRTTFAAIEYINNNIPPLSSFMTDYYKGCFLPAFTTQKVYIGHEGATFNFWEKWEISNKFYSGQMLQREIKKLFEDNHLTYVFWSAGNFPPHYESLFQPLFQNSDVRIYQYINK